MTVQIRLIEPDELPAWGRSVGVPFLRPVSADSAEEADRWEPPPTGRAWAADDGGHFVGNCCTYPRRVGLPAGPGQECPQVGFAAVTAVGVHPTHRRRGLLGGLMRAMLDDARRRGECLAGLIASEGAIYGRFGFGIATLAATRALRRADSSFLHPAPPADIRLLSPTEAASTLPDLYAAAASRQPGQVDRPEAVWRINFADWPDRRRGRSANFYAATDGGYVQYRVEEDHAADAVRLHVRDLVAVSADVEAALWRFVLDIDLVDEVVASPRPPVDPLTYRLADPRRLRTTGVSDFLWLRVLDPAAALTARGYRSAGHLVLEVDPPASPSDVADPAAGRWCLDADVDGSTCRPASRAESADLRLGVADLATLLTGAAPASVLAAAGRLGEQTPGALDVADRLFWSRPAPFSSTGF